MARGSIVIPAARNLNVTTSFSVWQIRSLAFERYFRGLLRKTLILDSKRSNVLVDILTYWKWSSGSFVRMSNKFGGIHLFPFFFGKTDAPTIAFPHGGPDTCAFYVAKQSKRSKKAAGTAVLIPTSILRTLPCHKHKWSTAVTLTTNQDGTPR